MYINTCFDNDNEVKYHYRKYLEESTYEKYIICCI